MPRALTLFVLFSSFRNPLVNYFIIKSGLNFKHTCATGRVTIHGKELLQVLLQFVTEGQVKEEAFLRSYRDVFAYINITSDCLQLQVLAWSIVSGGVFKRDCS